MTLEDDTRPVLLRAFELAGLEITLRALIDSVHRRDPGSQWERELRELYHRYLDRNGRDA